MVPKKCSRQEGHSSASLVRPNPLSVAKSPRKPSIDDDPILKEIDEYAADP